MHCYPLGLPTDLVNHAFRGTSFTPEDRGSRYVAGCQAELDADMERLFNHATIGGTKDKFEAEADRYRSGFRKHLVSYLQSSSRCVASFIAGPSNFPARRMNKRADIAHRRMEELIEYRRRAMQAAIRNLRPDLRPIMAGDADAIERLEKEIEQAERSHAQMKAANVAIRKHAKAGADHQVAALMEQGFAEERARELLKPDFGGRIGFADYAITNNGSNIRRMKQRLESLKTAKATPVTTKEGENGIRLEDDPPANRVRLYFPGKPDEVVRERLKSNGFRWTPSLGAWQAYRNYPSMLAAKSILGDEVAA